MRKYFIYLLTVLGCLLGWANPVFAEATNAPLPAAPASSSKQIPSGVSKNKLMQLATGNECPAASGKYCSDQTPYCCGSGPYYCAKSANDC